MSRIGRLPITLPAGVDIAIDGQAVTVKGPKGQLALTVAEPIRVGKGDSGAVEVSRPDDERTSRSLHGLTRTLLANMVIGVTDGYARTLEILGIGYRASREGKNIVLQVGFSHPVRVIPPEGVTFEVMDRRSANEPQQVVVRGIDKQLVGEEAAKLRSIRPPEPYKGYGIKYQGERVRRKAGKTGKTK